MMTTLDRPTSMRLKSSTGRKRRRRHSFTLVELLTVMVIISILAVLSLTAYTQIVRSQALAAGTQMLAGALDGARQSAVTHDNRVEFRLYQLPDYNASSSSTPTAYRAFQTFLITGNSTNILTKIAFFPAPVIVSTDAANCSIASLTATSGNTFTQGSPGASSPQLIPGYGGNYNALVFDFAPTGGLEPASPLTLDSQWYLTLYLEKDPVAANGLPKNFSTIQIDPLNGRTKVFRP